MDANKERYLNWLTDPLGLYLSELEISLVGNYLKYIFGYNLMMFGNKYFAKTLEYSRVRSKVLVTESGEINSDCIVANYAKLPFLNNSIDLAYLPHILEFESDPINCLKEVYRTLIGEGYLIISGYNPVSLFGAMHATKSIFSKKSFNGKFFSSLRLKDWLGAIGFDIIQVSSIGFCLPTQVKSGFRSQVIESLGQESKLNLGATYVLVAKKRVSTITPVTKWYEERIITNRFAKEQTVSELSNK